MTNPSHQSVRSEAATEDLIRDDAYRQWQEAVEAMRGVGCPKPQ